MWQLYVTFWPLFHPLTINIISISSSKTYTVLDSVTLDVIFLFDKKYEISTQTKHPSNLYIIMLSETELNLSIRGQLCFYFLVLNTLDCICTGLWILTSQYYKTLPRRKHLTSQYYKTNLLPCSPDVQSAQPVGWSVPQVLLFSPQQLLTETERHSA